MAKRDYRQMLLDRMKATFLEWQNRDSIAESELYRFLHTLKGTSGTIGMDNLSEFCSSQLQILSSDKENLIPVHTLEKFINRILRYFEEEVDIKRQQVPDVTDKRFTEEAIVLIIDDDLEFVSMLKELLETMGAQVVIAMNGKRGIEQFYSVRPNILLIDLHLPDMSGFHILDHIAETAMERHITVAITSVDSTNTNQKLAYERGAMDFLEKPLDLEIFIPYMLNRQEMSKNIEKSIITDGLTGVGNRRHFEEMIDYFIELAERSDIVFSLVMLDLDHFKQVNDKFGHPAGDEVLKKLGEVAKREKRETDHIFRYGGEEFAFLLPGETAEDAVHFVGRIRKEFDTILFNEGDNPFSVTFSAGIATFESDRRKLISSADQALYEAKRSGRNQTVIYDEKTSTLQRKLHIIIVDDDNLIRTMLTRKLEQLVIPKVDVTVHAFEDGPTFLDSDWYRPEEYYIILLDGILPEMDGLEVLGRIKREQQGNNILVSMMTARTGDADIKAALWLGADDYIMKPFKSDEVYARIQKLAGRVL